MSRPPALSLSRHHAAHRASAALLLWVRRGSCHFPCCHGCSGRQRICARQRLRQGCLLHRSRRGHLKPARRFRRRCQLRGGAACSDGVLSPGPLPQGHGTRRCRREPCLDHRNRQRHRHDRLESADARLDRGGWGHCRWGGGVVGHLAGARRPCLRAQHHGIHGCCCTAQHRRLPFDLHHPAVRVWVLPGRRRGADDERRSHRQLHADQPDAGTGVHAGRCEPLDTPPGPQRGQPGLGRHRAANQGRVTQRSRSRRGPCAHHALQPGGSSFSGSQRGTALGRRGCAEWHAGGCCRGWRHRSGWV